MALVNRLRERVNNWRREGYPGVTRTTLELLQWWRREGREKRLFFAQIEAAETVIFLTEARIDFRQGIEIVCDEPSDDRKADGYAGFLRYACKMATGSGKTTVMGMLAAWSILNKINDRSDGRFSDAVLVVCPNVTIRDRLREIQPSYGEASVYRTRDLVPPHLMPLLSQGKVAITNWHVFEPHTAQTGGVSARVMKTGVRVATSEWVTIAPKTTSARGKRYMSEDDLARQRNLGMLEVLDEQHEPSGSLKKVRVATVRYVESDTAVVKRVLDPQIGTKQNVLVINDEAHHAYRIRRDEPEEGEIDDFGDEEEAEDYFREATVWIDGLDRVEKLRGINLCIDLSATPYFLGRVGQDTNRPFPWVVSDFNLVEAIESGLVKIPQLAARDTSGAQSAQYFNIWQWILRQLTPAERGGKKGSPKPEAILKYAHHPIAILAGEWEQVRVEWEKSSPDPRPPVFIIVCKNTRIAKVIYDWIAGGESPSGIPPANIAGFRNTDVKTNTIRVDSKVVHETDAGGKSDETRWMRFTLDTVGKVNWPADRQGSPIYPEGFAELAQKLERPLHPPGRDVRCIVSVGMLTEGWDCNTVTHIVGLRPFMSQLLCEQVVGRGLRRASYEFTEESGEPRFKEEVAQILGVPFEIIPMKARKGAAPQPPARRNHVHAIPAKASFEITFPRVEGYTQAIRTRITVDWSSVPPLPLKPDVIPPEVQLKSSLPLNSGRPSLYGPGKLSLVDLEQFRSGRRIQELVFDLARTLTREAVREGRCEVPAHALFPQIAQIVQRYVDEKVEVQSPATKKDLFLAPYYGWLEERLREALRPDASTGEAPEIPRYEASRGPGSTAEVDFWSSRDVREVQKSHVNFVVADTKKWEQQAAYYIDRHDRVS
ncbi:MAG TPA: hypothetical protein VMO47_01570, partial [Rhodothermales bacterium]|nr:hypothetical protein [Rhodothermales bacterium]